MARFLNGLAIWLFTFAAAWGLLAGLMVLLSAGGTMVTESNGGAPQTQQMSWYQMQGWWGIAILFIFAALFYAPLHFLRRDSRVWAAVFSFAAIVLSALTGFSIGGYYILGAGVLLLGMLALPFAERGQTVHPR